MKDFEFGSYPGLSRQAQRITGSSLDGNRARGHVITEVEASVMKGLETGLEKARKCILL